jgi:hypothetical protein
MQEFTMTLKYDIIFDIIHVPQTPNPDAEFNASFLQLIKLGQYCTVMLCQGRLGREIAVL